MRAKDAKHLGPPTMTTQPADGMVIGYLRGEQGDYRADSPTFGRPYRVQLGLDQDFVAAGPA